MNHSVSLVHATPDGDDLIAYMARVSNPKGQLADGSKLIKYLIKHKHWSPFEMVNMCVEINTTRSIASQLLRHRSFSFQEFSQRYADPNVLGDIQLPQLRKQDTKNRQNSIDNMKDFEKDIWDRMIDRHFKESIGLYKSLIQDGIAKECAREVLPMATNSKLYMNGTLRSWIHYVQLRSGNGTQKEHRLIANQVDDLIEKNFPLVSEVLNEKR